MKREKGDGHFWARYSQSQSVTAIGHPFTGCCLSIEDDAHRDAT